MALGKSVYKLIFDANAAETLVPTRRELAATKAIMEETIPAADRYAAAWDALNQLLNKDLITTEAYNQTLAALRAELPENIARAQDLAEAQGHAAEIVRSLTTAEQEYAAKRAAANEALQAGLVTQQEYDAYLDRERQRLPAVIEERKRLADEQTKLNELNRRAAQINREVETSEERMRRELAELDVVYKSTNMSAETHERKLRQIHAAYQQTTPAVAAASPKMALLTQDVNQLGMSLAGRIPVLGSFTSTLAALGPTAIAVGASFVTLKAGFEAVEFIITGIMAQAEKIARLDDEAQKLGTSARGLQAYQRAAQEAGGVDMDASARSLEKMQVAIAKVASGDDKKLADLFARLGLDAGQMAIGDAVENFKALQSVWGQIESPAEQARVAMQLFGKAGIALIPTLESGNDALKRQEEWLTRVGVALGDADRTGVAAMTDEWERLADIQDGIWSQITAEAAPAFEGFAVLLRESVVDTGLLQAGFAVLPATVDVLAAGISAVQIGIGGAAMSAAALAEGLAIAGRTAAAMPGSGLILDRNELQETTDALEAFATKLSQAGAVNIEGGLTGRIGAEMEAARQRAEEAAAKQKRDEARLKALEGTAADPDVIRANEQEAKARERQLDAIMQREKEHAIEVMHGKRALLEYRLAQQQATDEQRAAVLADYDAAEATLAKQKLVDQLADAEKKRAEQAAKIAEQETTKAIRDAEERTKAREKEAEALRRFREEPVNIDAVSAGSREAIQGLADARKQASFSDRFARWQPGPDIIALGDQQRAANDWLADIAKTNKAMAKKPDVSIDVVEVTL